MELRPLGLFAELFPDRASLPLLKEAINRLSSDVNETIASYLEQSPIFVASPGVLQNVLDGGNDEIVGTTSWHTDGMWVWRDDLAFYVRRYRVGLPDEFLRHARTRNYMAPLEREVDLTGLSFPAI